MDVFRAASYLELRTYLVNTLLRDTDCMSMAHSLEVRVPLLDRVVVEFVAGLPGEWKANWRRPKATLREALEDALAAPAVRAVWEEFEAGRTGWARPWSLFVLAEWPRAHLD